MSYYLVSNKTRAYQSLLCLVLALVLFSLCLYYAYENRVKPVVDARMELSCAWPKNNGEMTVVTVENGKIKCWRWK